MESYFGIGGLPASTASTSISSPAEKLSTRRRIDIKLYHSSEIAFAVLYFTGSGDFNRAMRLYAMKRGFSLSDKALSPVIWDAKTKSRKAVGTRISCATEQDIFAALQLTYVEPHGRDLVPQQFL